MQRNTIVKEKLISQVCRKMHDDSETHRHYQLLWRLIEPMEHML